MEFYERLCKRTESKERGEKKGVKTKTLSLDYLKVPRDTGDFFFPV